MTPGIVRMYGLIVATARHHGTRLLTADRAILDYGAAGHVRTVDARD